MTTKTKPGFVTAMFMRDKEDQVWLVELKEEPRVHSFGKSLKDAEQNIRDAAALWYQQEVNLKLEYHGLNDDTLSLREKVLELREQAADLQLNAMTALRYVATLMEDE